MTTPPSRHPDAANNPPLAEIVERLREVFGTETPVGPHMIRWWVPGERRARTPDAVDEAAFGVALMIDTTPRSTQSAEDPCVIWVTRPGESQAERCPIVTMGHLEAFLALVSIARRSPAPVHRHVCPGED
jgi:hypothetical protein